MRRAPCTCARNAGVSPVVLLGGGAHTATREKWGRRKGKMEKRLRRRNPNRRAIAIAPLILAVLSLAPSAAAQGCAMCYDSAQQQGPEAAHALNIGIIVLLLPSLMLFGGVIVTALRHREARGPAEQTLR
jgi:hypothetical protein